MGVVVSRYGRHTRCTQHYVPNYRYYHRRRFIARAHTNRSIRESTRLLRGLSNGRVGFGRSENTDTNGQCRRENRGVIRDATRPRFVDFTSFTNPDGRPFSRESTVNTLLFILNPLPPSQKKGIPARFPDYPKTAVGRKTSNEPVRARQKECCRIYRCYSSRLTKGYRAPCTQSKRMRTRRRRNASVSRRVF